MGLFSKLFSKKEKQTENKDDNKIRLDTPFGRFCYTANPPTNEYGYEGYIDWYPNGIEDQRTEAFVDSDTPQTTEAESGFERLAQLMYFKDRLDIEIKSYAADFFLSRTELISKNLSPEELIEKWEIIWIGIYRNGDTEFLIQAFNVDADDVTIKLKADGSKEIHYLAEIGDQYKDIVEKI